MKKITPILVLLLIFTMAISFGSVKTQAAESNDYTIKVNVGTNCVTVYNKKGKPVRAMICSPSNETPIGTFYTPVKYRWHEMIGNCYAQYCTRITWDGVLFHSVWHYRNGDHSSMSVAAYNVMGQKASHGCVRLLCKDAKWIYDNCALKTKVVIFRGTSKDDPLGRPSFTPIRNGKFTDWDPTDPDPKNPYLKAKPTIKAISKNIEYKSKVTARTAVEIKDALGNDLTKKNAKIKIKGKIDTSKLGTYKVKYSVKDQNGNSQTATIKFKVVDTKKPKITGAKNKKKIAMGESKNVLAKVKARTASGIDITDKIKVTVINMTTKKKVQVVNGVVKFTTAGEYKVTYSVKAPNKQKRKKTVTYTVLDKRVIAAMKATKVTVEYGSTFNAFDYVESIMNYNETVDLPINANNVKVSGNVDTTKPGTYTLVYTFSNNGKDITVISKTLTVVVKVKPAEEETTTSEETTQEEETTTAAEETSEKETA
ncbi:MAG: DUF5011 domain-containing protein [Lachnospiraceae bacterium]|nr:DUF5011 domain-containing protein [Lachnospiraceae bacterium]